MSHVRTQAERLLNAKTITLLRWRLARGDPNSDEHGKETATEVDPDRFAQREGTHRRREHRIDRHSDGGSGRRRAFEREHPKEKGGGATEHAQIDHRHPLRTIKAGNGRITVAPRGNHREARRAE